MGATSEPWCLISVYGPQLDADKVEFLEELRLIQSQIACPLDDRWGFQSHPGRH